MKPSPTQLVKMMQDQANLAADWIELQKIEIAISFLEEQLRSHQADERKQRDTNSRRK